MDKEARQFLYDLLKTPSISGFETQIQQVVKSRMEKYADYIESDLHGNLIVSINPRETRRVMLAGHCDQIGFMVKHISKEGYLYVIAVGGVDGAVLPGSIVTVHSAKGPVTGVFGRKPIHLQSSEERDRLKLELEKFWIDIGAKNQKEAEKRVSIGDAVTFKLEVTELSDNLIAAPGIDNKAGLFVAMETLRLCAQSKFKNKIKCALYAVSTVQEEIGTRGAQTSAFGINPEVGIAIDVYHASDNPGQERHNPVPLKLGEGPGLAHGPNVNPKVEALLLQSAKRARITLQKYPCGRPLGNDARAIQVSRQGVATASVAVPNRYMHTQVEVCALSDLVQCSKLLASFVEGIKTSTDFKPI